MFAKGQIMKAIPQVLVFFALLASASSQAPVRFCDLLRNPDEYNGREVIVRATYRYGFEWQQLYCLDCLDKGRVWLELPYDTDDDAAVKSLKRAPKGAGVVNITVQGIFVSGGHFGHMNGYKYKFVAQKVSDVAVVLKGMKSPSQEKKAEEQWACGATYPR
jgi:hypothetical protein